MIDKVKNKIGKAYREIAVNFVEAPKESKFETEGQLIPTEFVKAGDQLVLKSKTWR